MNKINLKSIKITFFIYTLFVSFSYADLPKITGIFPPKGTDENGHISILGSNLKEIKQVLFQTNEGVIAVPQIVIFDTYIKVYLVPKNVQIANISILGSFGISNTKIDFFTESPSISNIFYSYDKEGKNYLIITGDNLNFIEKCSFKTNSNTIASSTFIYFGAFGQTYIPRNATDGIISISGASFETKKTEINFLNQSQHIPENDEIINFQIRSDVKTTNEIMIYPNPSNGSFAILGKQNIATNDIKVIDIFGNIIPFIWQSNQLTISKSGIYFIHICGKKIKAVVI